LSEAELSGFENYQNSENPAFDENKSNEKNKYCKFIIVNLKFKIFN